MESDITSLLKTKQYGRALMLMERKALNRETVFPGLLEKVPERHLQGAPVLLHLFCQELLLDGKLLEAKRLLAINMKTSADMALPKHFLITLSLLIQVQIRLGDGESAGTFLQFLRREYEEGETEFDGIIPLTLALGTGYLPGSGKDRRTWLLQAWDLFSEAQDIRGMAMALIELCFADRGNLNDPAVGRLFAIFERTVEYEGVCGEYLDLVRQVREMCLKSCYLGGPRLSGNRTAGPESLPAYYRELLQAMLRLFESSDRRLARPSLHTVEEGIDLGIQFLQAIGAEAERSRALFAGCKLPMHLDMLQMSQPEEPEREEKQGLDIRLFHDLSIRKPDGQAVAVNWKRQKSLEVLIYLLLQPNFTVSKEKMLDALFPHVELSKMNSHLGVAVFQLNKDFTAATGLPGIARKIRGSVCLQIEGPVFLDVKKYLELADSADLLWDQQKEQAVERYEAAYGRYGPFLPGLEEQEWLDKIREVLLQKQIGVILRLAEYARMKRRYARAEKWYRETIALEPHNELLYDQLISVLVIQDKAYEARRWKSERIKIQKEYALQERS